MKKLLILLGSSISLSSCGAIDQNIYLSCIYEKNKYTAFYKIEKIGEDWSISAYDGNENTYVPDNFFIPPNSWKNNNFVSVDPDYIIIEDSEKVPTYEADGIKLDFNTSYKINRATGSMAEIYMQDIMKNSGRTVAICETSTDQITTNKI